MRQKVWHSARKGEDAGASELFIPRNQSIGSQRPRRAMTDDDGWEVIGWSGVVCAMEDARMGVTATVRRKFGSFQLSSPVGSGLS